MCKWTDSIWNISSIGLLCEWIFLFVWQVESAEERKSKSEVGNEGPVSKKMKHHPVVQFYEEAYDKQVGLK
jgi:hypothetical protein